MARKKQAEIKVEDAEIIIDEQTFTVSKKQESVTAKPIILTGENKNNENEIPIHSMYRRFVNRFLGNGFCNLGNNVVGSGKKIANDEELAKIEKGSLSTIHGYKYLRKSKNPKETFKLIYDSLKIGGVCLLIDENEDYTDMMFPDMPMVVKYGGRAFSIFHLSTGYGFWKENKNLFILMFIKIK